MVLHTVNPALAQDITYIINHAEDRVLVVDASLWHLIEPSGRTSRASGTSSS